MKKKEEVYQSGIICTHPDNKNQDHCPLGISSSGCMGCSYLALKNKKVVGRVEKAVRFISKLVKGTRQ